MGEQGSKLDAAVGDGAASASGAMLPGDGGTGATVEGTAATVQGAGSVDAGAAEAGAAEGLPSESDILVRLMQELGKAPGCSMAMNDIRESLPPALKLAAGDNASITKWLAKFSGLLEVTGAAGEERVALTLFRAPPPAAEPPPVAPVSAPAVSAPVVLAVASAGHEEDGRDDGNSSAVQLRGLPFRATVSEIKTFLGSHAQHLATGEPAVRLLLNRDNRPSGFALIQFTTPEAARQCREQLHKQQMGDRYVEVLACSERAGKVRHRRAATGDGPPDEGAVGQGADLSGGLPEAQERERVLQECREHMNQPGRQQLLLSMLGIALSPPSRTYLRHANLGLKHFLARYPAEFRVDGPKGCERVVWCPGGMVTGMPVEFGPIAGGLVFSDAPATYTAAELRDKQERTPMVSPAPRREPPSAHLMQTHSDWGTPDSGFKMDTRAARAAQEAAAQQAAMEYAGFPGFPGAGGGWPPYSFPPWMPEMPGACGWPPSAGHWPPPEHRGPEESSKAHREGASRRAVKAGDAPASRSHAHLHPQSHPFANRPAVGEAGSRADEATVAQTPPALGDAGTPDSAKPALRLRGLPFSVSVQDVLAFFAQHDVADLISDGPQAAQLLTKANGRPSGQAVVQMKSRPDAETAQHALHHQYVAGRYIEVFVYGDKTGDDKDNGFQAPAAAGAGYLANSAGSGVPAIPADISRQWSPGMKGLSWAQAGPMTPPWAGLVNGPAAVAPPSAVSSGGIPAGFPGGSPARPGVGTVEDDNFNALFSFLYEPPPEMGSTGGPPPMPFGEMPAATPPGGDVVGMAAPPPVPVDTPARAALQV